MKIKSTLLSTFFFISFGHTIQLQATTYKVTNTAEFKAHVATKLKPNDTMILTTGVWRDAEMVFKGQGAEAQPIVLMSAQVIFPKLKDLFNISVCSIQKRYKG